MKNKITENVAHEIISLFYEGNDYKKIGDTVKLSEITIYRFIKSHNLKSTNRKKPHRNSFNLNEIGNKYNHLTIVGTEYNDKFRTWCAKCICDCGNETIDTLRRLKNGEKKTCGKQNCTFHKNLRIFNGTQTTTTGYEDILGSIWARWRIGAKKRNIDFLITIEEAWEIYIKQNKKCALSGMNILFQKGENRIQTASLDRIDSSKPYIKENIQWVHKKINMMKGNLNEIEFIELCKNISKWNNC